MSSDSANAQDPTASPVSSGSPRRIVRSLIVEATATSTGITSTLYCRVGLPTSSINSSGTTLLDLLPTTTLKGSSIYELPLLDVTEGARKAARLLEIPIAETDGRAVSASTTGRAVSPSTKQRLEDTLKADQDGDKIVLRCEGSDTKARTSTSQNDAGKAGDLQRNGAISPVGSRETGGGETTELIVVLELETEFGQLRNPKFANMITLPIPPCLRNSLRLTLPPAPSDDSDSSAAWDLKVHPSLSNVRSISAETASTSSPSTLVTGSFPSSSHLSIRWTRQLPAASPSPPFIVAHSSQNVGWKIDESGNGKAVVDVTGAFEYCGLRDTHWVEFRVGFGRRDGKDLGGDFEVSSIEGEGVVEWEVDRGNDTASLSEKGSSGQSSSTQLDDSFSSSITDDSLVDFQNTLATPTPQHRTPTPRRRYSTKGNEPRPPSWTSLFDTAPPVVSRDLEPNYTVPPPSLRARKEGSAGSGGAPSLLSQAAPFDPEASAMDMSFEETGPEGDLLGDQEVGAQSEADGAREETPGVDTQATPTKNDPDTTEPPRFATIRVQLSLIPLLLRSSTSTDSPPQFAFQLKLAFPAATLQSFAPASPDTDVRLALPSFSLPSATREDTLVSVSGASADSDTTANVTLLRSSESLQLEDLSDRASSRSEIARIATWRTSRAREDSRAGQLDRVEVQVELPFRKPRERNQCTEEGPPTEEGSSTAAVESISRVGKKVRAKREGSKELAPTKLARRPSSSSHGTTSPRSTLPLVQIEITPISPTLSLASPSPSDWRIFYRLRIPTSSIQELTIPVPTLPSANSKVKVHDVWGIDGQSIKFTSEMVGRKRPSSQDGKEEEEEKGTRVSGMDGDRIREVLYDERKAGEDIEGAALLPFLSEKVGQYVVQVLGAQGYDLNVVVHDFDLSDSDSKGSSRSNMTFTKFLVSADSRPFLPLRFRPSSSNPHSLASGTASSGPGHHLSSLKEKELRLARQWLDLAYIAPLYCLILIFVAGAAFRGQRTSDPPSPASTSLLHTPKVIPTASVPPAVYPLISYSTITKTSSAVHTTTHLQTLTETRTSTKTVSLPLATTTKTNYILAASEPTPTRLVPSPPSSSQDYLPSSSRDGNPVLVWLEELRISVRMYLEDWLRTLRHLVA
ncbi:hypothetical protein JCM16303_000570 [Sporobolomyces ruberrimus]